MEGTAYSVPRVVLSMSNMVIQLRLYTHIYRIGPL